MASSAYLAAASGSVVSPSPCMSSQRVPCDIHVGFMSLSRTVLQRSCNRGLSILRYGAVTFMKCSDKSNRETAITLYPKVMLSEVNIHCESKRVPL